MEVIKNLLHQRMLSLVEKDLDGVLIGDIEAAMPAHLCNTGTIEAMLLEMKQAGEICEEESRIIRAYPSVMDVLSDIGKETHRKIVIGRLAGRTLSDLGEENNITRERARQIVKNTIEKIQHNYPRLKESKYSSLFANYIISMDDFCQAFGEDANVYRYLYFASKADKKKFQERKPLVEAMDDSRIPASVRRQLECVVDSKTKT